MGKRRIKNHSIYSSFIVTNIRPDLSERGREDFRGFINLAKICNLFVLISILTFYLSLGHRVLKYLSISHTYHI